MPSVDRLERLTNLVLVLLDARQPLSLDALAQAVPGYPEEHEARRQAFERDKRLLREEGIPLSTEAIAGDAQYGYRIEPDAFYLPDLELAPEEQAALHLAVAGVHLGDPSGRHALLKLGAAGLGDAWPTASMVPPPALVPLFEAVRARAEVGFAYRGAARRAAPAAVWFRRGHWYLVGWDLDRDAARTFRVDRVEGTPEVGAPGSAAVPEGFDAAAAVPDEPWRVGSPGEEAEELVTVGVDAVEGPRVAREVGASGTAHPQGDGSVVIELPVINRAAFRSWVLGLLDHAEVLAPPDVRRDIVDWLTAIAEGNGAGGTGADAGAGARAGAHGAGPAAPEAAGRPRSSGGPTGEDTGRSPGARLRRLLAIVGWLARVGEASIAEVAERFGISEDEVVRELELAACCGVPPYTPDVLMEIEVTDTSVRTFLPQELGRARRLTPAEGFALAAAARTILAVPGADADGALARALAKLEAALGGRSGLVVELEQPELLEAVRAAVAAHAQLEIEYYSASSDELTTRVVDPLRVFTLEGHWYLDAYCHRAGDVRRFRVDRTRSARQTGEAPEAVAPAAPGGAPGAVSATAFVPGPGTRHVRLRLGPAARWLLDSVPTEERREHDDGTIEVVVAVGGTGWLERLLLQLGSAASVVAPADLRAAGAGAARRLLAVYGAASPPSLTR